MHKKDALTVSPVELNATGKPLRKNSGFIVWNASGLSFGPGKESVLAGASTGLSYG